MVCHVPSARPVRATVPRERLLIPRDGLLINICALRDEVGFARLAGNWISRRIDGPTDPIELTGALLRRAEPCAVTSNEPAPCVRLELKPTMLAIAEGSKAQSAIA